MKQWRSSKLILDCLLSTLFLRHFAKQRVVIKIGRRRWSNPAKCGISYATVLISTKVDLKNFSMHFLLLAGLLNNSAWS